MFNIYQDPNFVKNYHTEYLKLINFYKNLKRPSSFIKYFNINTDNSTKDDRSESTYDIYKYSDVRFDIYDYTPSYYLAPIVNTATNVQDMRGQTMDASTSITLYSIKRPRINDLVVFYDPVKSGEIYRVQGLRVPTNALHSEPNLTWYELDLEIAPIKKTDELKIFRHYIYDLSCEKYSEYNDFKNLMNKYSKYTAMMEELTKFYEPYNDIYKWNNLAPLVVNELVILFKRKYNFNYMRLFENFKTPYGYTDRVNKKIESFNDFKFDIVKEYEFPCLNLDNGQIEIHKFNMHHDDYTHGLNLLIYLAHQFYLELVKYGDNN